MIQKTKRKKKIIFVGMLLLFSFLFSCPAFAEEMETRIGNTLHQIGLEAAEESVQSVIEESGEDTLSNFSFSQMVEKIIYGDFTFSPKEILIQGLKKMTQELFDQLYFIQRLILIAVLSAVLKNLNGSFQGKSVSELSFYVCYLVLLVLIMNAFQIGVQMVSDVCGSMVTFIEAILPVFTALMFTSGSYVQLAFLGPVVIGAAGLLSALVQNVALPAIIMATALHLVNYISERNVLHQMSELLKGTIGWGLKGISIAFMAMVSLQRMGVPVLNKMIGRTARVAVGAVPVVGDVMAGAVELGAALAGAVNSGVGVAAILFLIGLCITPLIKLIVMILIYKMTAAVLEPVCERRLVKCISAAGDFSVLLLSALFTVEVMFIFTVIVLMSTA